MSKNIEKAVNRETSTTNQEKEVSTSRVDRKTLIREAYEYTGKLTVDMDLLHPGFVPQWVHDVNGEVHKHKRIGFEHVLDYSGEPLMRVVNTRGDDKGLKAYLMQCPPDIAAIIDEVRAEKNMAPLEALKKEKDPNFPTLGLKVSSEKI